MICEPSIYYLLINTGDDKMGKGEQRRDQLNSSWTKCSLCDWMNYPIKSPSSHFKSTFELLCEATYEVA